MLCDECGHEYTSVSSQKRADTCVKDHKARRTVINSRRISMKFQLSVCLIAYCPFRGTPSSSVCLKKNNSEKIMSDAVVFVLRS